MNTNKTKLKKLFSSKLCHDFQSEIILCLIVFISFTLDLIFNNRLLQWTQEKLPDDINYLYWWFATLLPITYFLNQKSKKVTALKYLYYITPFLFILGYFIPIHTIEDSYPSAFLLTLFLSSILLFIQLIRWNNRMFTRNKIYLTRNLIFTLLGTISILTLILINITMILHLLLDE